MPRYEITSPDGRRFEITAPEGATQEQVLAYAQANAPKATETPKAPDPTEGNSFGENAIIGVGKAFTDLGRGARKLYAKTADAVSPRDKNLSGLVTGQDNSRTAEIQREIDESRKLDAPLMNTAGGVAGNIAGNVIPAAATVMIPGANAYTGAALSGAVLGALQPTSGDESILANTAIGAAGGVGGKFVGDKVGAAVASRVAASRAGAGSAAAQNAERDAILRAGQDAGYVAPPSQANPSLTNRVLEGFSGKIQTGQAASVRNQKVTNDAARAALGIEKDLPITPEVLRDIRSTAGQAYEALRGAGTINADRQFTADLAKITQKFEGAAKDFPDLARNEVAEIVASVNKPSFAADSAIDAIAILRERASAAFAKGDKGLGSAYRQTSQAMEDAIERNLIESGNRELLKGFQDARRVIAKTYTVEKALNPGGNVNAQKLAAQLKAGKPLTDELKTAAEFASRFPKAAQNVDQIGSTPGMSPLDFVAGLGLSTVDMGAGAAAAFARPVTRAGLLSAPYQRAMTRPAYEASGTALDAVVNNPRLRALLPAAGANSGLGYFE